MASAIGKVVVAAGLLAGAALGLSATGELRERTDQPTMQPVPTTVQYDPPGGYCDQKDVNVCETPNYGVPTSTNPGDRFLCVEEPESEDCRRQQEEEADGLR